MVGVVGVALVLEGRARSRGDHIREQGTNSVRCVLALCMADIGF